jgi:hypothetical protein
MRHGCAWRQRRNTGERNAQGRWSGHRQASPARHGDKRGGKPGLGIPAHPGYYPGIPSPAASSKPCDFRIHYELQLQGRAPEATAQRGTKTRAADCGELSRCLPPEAYVHRQCPKHIVDTCIHHLNELYKKHIRTGSSLRPSPSQTVLQIRSSSSQTMLSELPDRLPFSRSRVGAPQPTRLGATTGVGDSDRGESVF